MNDQLWILAFVIAPVMAVLWGYALVYLHDRELKKRHPRPGE